MVWRALKELTWSCSHHGPSRSNSKQVILQVALSWVGVAGKQAGQGWLYQACWAGCASQAGRAEMVLSKSCEPRQWFATFLICLCLLQAPSLQA